MYKLYKHREKLTVLTIIIIFYLYNLNRIEYGLPFFINLDESEFQYSSLSYLSFITGYKGDLIEAIYAPLINVILILIHIFFNEFILNSLNIQEIISKIYFNPELFIMYGRLASLTVTSLSIFLLYLIFKKLKISLYLYSLILVSFTTSLYSFDVSTINGKNSYYLFFFLFQLYFFLKYLLKTNKFNFKSYIIFGFLGSLAWGVNYWPAIVSFYAVFILHFKKFKFQHLNYLLTFLIIFFIFGPILNLIVSNHDILRYFDFNEKSYQFQISVFINNLVVKFFDGLNILFNSEKNILLLLIFFPIYLFKKNTNYKKEFLIISLLIFEPILIFALAEHLVIELRYLGGSICVIIILTALIFNELSKTNLKYLGLIFIIFNFYIIFNNINVNNKINNVISKKHSFYEFNKDINDNSSKILYLVNLGFQESLKQNQLYIELYEKDNLIKKNMMQKEFIKIIKNKIKKINNTKNIIINDSEIKEKITYLNYTHLLIDDFQLFFDFIKEDFDYVVIEESMPFYLTNHDSHKKIKKYVQNNFLLEKRQFKENKIFFRSLRSIINYYNNTLSDYDFRNDYNFKENMDNAALEKIYGSNYALYNLNE
tara:strand:+ start:129 stop:1922 length:1794 start_codon:yes stop_codon:yes gene_type:complete